MESLRWPTKLEWIAFLVAVAVAFFTAIYFGDEAAENLKLIVGCLAAIYTVYLYLKK